ncbi:adenosylmethionine decarboxylase [Conchiformibius steedae DSM 2580]|uniref:Adenosylmethionine decarboxylase n=1 Tax=Conchiformibius steedae DSM 2580 TaxID=1121352 RepID=A0AAE9L0J8_9NEIS|nr:adenosylmethionine decarboxylase [Conchiformibius steedae]QMT33496.1 adenosylmethionine decarboxylase [Conchiformibius steedae]URD68154.1 adenosylmethionine decarboxylase [Conchiformibius steedae DSM 2580]
MKQRHGLLDLYGCPPDLLRDAAALEQILRRSAEAAGATVLWHKLHTFGGGGGVTGVLLLAESHISIHTWPEHSFAAADIFLCGELKLQHARQILQHALQARDCRWIEQHRGEQIVFQPDC